MLFTEFVFDGVRGGVAAEPEVLDELLALFIGLQTHEGGAFLIGDDVGDVLIQPMAIGRGKLFAELLFLGLALLIGHGPGSGLGDFLVGLLTVVGLFRAIVLLRRLLRDGENARQKRPSEAEQGKASSFHTAHRRFLDQG